MKARFASLIVATFAFGGFTASSAPAWGQESAATAEALFREARDLAAQGKYDQACPKYAASQRLDPGFGTLYNLGECLAHQGRTASAWATFTEAAAMAKSAGQAERDAKATRAASVLEAKLERLKISVKHRVPGLVVKRGGQVIDEAAWGSALPVDPGKHVIEVTAPGQKTFTVEVASPGPGQSAVVEIPELEAAPLVVVPERLVAPVAPVKQPVVAVDAAPPADTGANRRIAGYVVGSAGVVGLIVGAVMGASAKSSLDSAQSGHCKGTVCDQTGVNDINSAKSSATASTVGFVAGGVLAATGVVLIVTALPPKASTTARDTARFRSVRFEPRVGPTGGGLDLRASF